MKTNQQIKWMLAGLLLTTPTLAQLSDDAGDRGGNGGDSCELRIQNIREDLKNFIEKDGASNLNYRNQDNAQVFKTKMIEELTNKNLVIQCTSKKLFVGNTEKTCKNGVSNNTPFIMCNYNRFMMNPNSNTTEKKDVETAQYILTTHEFAGLAGFEVNQSENSDYFYSNQISEYLVDQVIKKLSVKASETYTTRKGHTFTKTANGGWSDPMGITTWFPVLRGKNAVGSYESSKIRLNFYDAKDYCESLQERFPYDYEWNSLRQYFSSLFEMSKFLHSQHEDHLGQSTYWLQDSDNGDGTIKKDLMIATAGSGNSGDARWGVFGGNKTDLLSSKLKTVVCIKKNR